MALETVSAQTLYFTNSVPTNWTAASGSLAISTNHYKAPANLPSQCLQWNYAINDILTVTNPGIVAGAVTDYYSNTCSLWVYNPAPLTNQSLTFKFIDAGGTAQYTFNFYLNYSGWRQVQRSFYYDPMGGPHANANFTKVAIVGPTNMTGQLFIDGIIWAGARFTRYQDGQNPDIDGLNSATNFYHCFYELPPDIPTNAPTPAELNDLATARAAWLADNAGSNPGSGTLASTWQSWSNLNIVASGSNLVSVAIAQTGIWSFESWIAPLGQSIYWSSNVTSSNLLNLFIRDLWDQGLDYNSNFGPYDQANGAHFDYSFRNTPVAFILAYKSYTPDFKQHVWQMLNWYFRQGHYWTQTYAPGLTAGGSDDYVSTDDIYTQINQELGAVLFLTPDDATAIQYLRGFSRFLGRFLAPTQGTDDGLKPDGCGFHHWGHYNHYMYAFPRVAHVVYNFNNTQFQISSNDYLNLRLAFMTMIRQANSPNAAHPTEVGFGPNSLSGRSPFQNSDIVIGYNDLQRLGVVGGPVLGQPVDPLVAQVYNRVFGAAYPYAAFNGYGTDTNTGFYQFNWSPVAVYAQSNWVACMHGMNSNFWGSEIQTGANLYGRYQSYGACEILYPGGDAASGWGLTGWDWNKPPGTTTILLPWAKLYMDEPLTYEIHDDKSRLNFSGGLAFRGNGICQGGNGGLYACNFQVYTNSSMTNHNGSFRWRKSWFCFTNNVICLGSNITNNDAVNPTITTLFQGLLSNSAAPTVVNGTSVTTFPYAQTNSLSSASWLLDGYGTGYFVRPGVNLVLSRSLQTSPDQAGSGSFSSTNYATAWINHGTAPAGAGYEYVVVPSTTATAMTQLAIAYTNPAASPYAVLECDATAHVVQWNPDGRIGYALFATNLLAAAVTNTGPIRSVSLPCLAMTQPVNGNLILSVVNPDLNLVNDVSLPTNLTVTLAGIWSIASGSTNASVIAGTTNTTTLQIQTFNGFPVEVLLAVAPNPPQGLTAIIAVTNQIFLTWQSVSNATGYIVLQGGSVIATVTSTNYLDTGLTAGTLYAYTVEATNAVGISPPSAVATATTPIAGVTFQWDASPGTSGAQDGSGIWGSALINWLYGTNNVGWCDQNWAVFGTNTTTNCTVTLANDVAPTGITFNPTIGTYIITGGNTLWTTNGLNLIVNSNAVINTPISGPGGLTKSGTGTLTISNANAYTGVTTVSAGTLNVAGNESGATNSLLVGITASSATTVNLLTNGVLVVGTGNEIRVGTNSYGSSQATTLNVNSVLTNNGTLFVGRPGVVNLNPGGTWLQNGAMTIRSAGGYPATLNVLGGAFTYAGSSPVVLSPPVVSPADNGYGKLTIGGGNFTTGQGFTNSAGMNYAGYAQIVMTNNGALFLSADIPQLTMWVNTNLIPNLWLTNGGGVINTAGHSTTISNLISGSGSLTKSGLGMLTLSATNTYTGATTISGGALQVNGSLGTNTVTVASGAVLGGGGNVLGSVILNGTLSPGGVGIGVFKTGGETWNGGGTFQFGLNNATNSSGWDLLAVTGALNLQATPGTPFTIRLVSLTASNTPGPVTGFSGADNYVWPLVTPTGGIINFNPAQFAVDASGFSNAFAGSFVVGTNGGALSLTYSAPPPLLTSATMVTGGLFHISFSGTSNQGYRVVASTNLTLPLSSWSVLSTGIFGASPVNYSENPTNCQRFYRIGSP